MSRTFHRIRRLGALSLLTALAALCLAFLPSAARAGAYTYGTGAQRTVNAGILLLDGNPTPGAPGTWPTSAFPDNKDPYVFYVLNQRTDIKPFGWNIVNPLAPSAVTPDVQLRWNARSGQNAYQLGQTVSPSMAAYWEVPLSSTSSDNLAQFDVLLLNLESTVSFTAADSEKLRRFVDDGGTLWIEDSGTGGVNNLAAPFFRLQFNNGGAAAGNYAEVSLVNRNALITTPFLLSTSELNSLGDKHVGAYDSFDQTNTAQAPQYTTTIVGNSGENGLPIVAAGSYGAGQIVVTCTGSANTINEYVGKTPYDLSAVGANSGPFCGTYLQNAPTADLKLVANILNAASTHLNEHQNTRQSGNDPGALPSAQHTWTALMKNLATGVTTGSASTGIAIYGHMAFVTDSNGKLHAFDIYPAENLDNNQSGNPDQGIQDYNNGVPWDEIWATTALGAGASAPTVAVDPTSGNAYVLVEDAKGNVDSYLASPTAGGAVTGTVITSNASTSYTAVQPAPAPTYYNERVYAGDHDGNLNVIGMASGTGTGTQATFLVNPNTAAPTAPEYVVAPPTVGIVPDAKGSNDILALVNTNQGLYSVFLGSRGEPLTVVGTNDNTKLKLLTNARMDIAASVTDNTPRTYTLDTFGYPLLQTTTPNAGAGANPNFSGYGGTATLFADYNADLVASDQASKNGPLTRTLVGASSATLTPTLMGTFVSAPALDRFGNVYYTVTDPNNGPDSVLFCVHDAPDLSSVHVNWRFRLPQTMDPSFVDADNTSYAPLAGMQFTTTANGQTYPSAPVVDEQGNVYVLATGAVGAPSAGSSAILCFNGLGTVSADLLASGDQSRVNSVTVTQPISGGSDEFGGTPTNISGAQYQINGGTLNFRNFASQTSVPGGAHALYPNLSEPYPITVSYSIGAPRGTPPTAAGGNAQTNATIPLHTNLTWYTVFAPAASSGLTKSGNTLYFMDGGHLYSTPADVQTEGFAITNKQIATGAVGSTGQQIVADQGDTGAGDTAAVPASAGGALLVSGPLGLSAFTNQVTLVVDSNRVLEMDSSGNAQWAVDATTKTTLAGDTTPIYSTGGNGATGNGQLVTTTLELNHPNSVYELAQNDYLVADTGNNRCVRFDRAGKVIWELTKFDDTTIIRGFKTNPLLKSGEPDTLNQPTSVQVQSTSDAAGDTVLHYLISDNGNYRILEVDDVYNTAQKLIGNHILKWISHTHDIQGREYRYQSANYYVAPSGKFYVAALIANKRIAPAPYTFPAAPTTAAQYAAAAPSLLAPANQDTSGGSIVLLDYDPANNITTPGFGTNDQADGFVATSADTTGLIFTPISVNSFYADLNGGKFDINTAATAVAVANGAPPTVTATATQLTLRNPRYLKVYATSVNGNTVRHYLLADDNGAFDLTPGTRAGSTVFYAQWGFTQADYQGVTTPISQEGVSGITTIGVGATTSQWGFDRKKVPFIPSSIQSTGTDVMVNGDVVGRYLITNSFSQGEASNAVGPHYDANGAVVQPGFSGEALEIQTLSNGTNLVLNEVHDNQYVIGKTPTTTVPLPNPNTDVARYTGHTLSRPASSNTSPLNQPTFAFRLQF